MSYNTQAGSLQYSFDAFNVPLKLPLKDKEPSLLTVELCGIFTSLPLIRYILWGTDLNISASKRKAATAVLGYVGVSKTSSVIDVSSKALVNLTSVLSAVTLVTVTVKGKSEFEIPVPRSII